MVKGSVAGVPKGLHGPWLLLKEQEVQIQHKKQQR